jgi:hypothetical protein
MPEPRASLAVRDGNDYDVCVTRPKHDVKGKPSKDRPTQIGREDRKPIRRNGDETDHSIQLIEESDCGPNAPLGVSLGGCVGVLQRRRMEARRPWHQPLNRLRS